MSFFNISWLLLLILFSILFDNKLVSGQCLNDQRDLLLQLNQSLTTYATYYTTYATLYTSKRSSWSLNTDCCSAWVGVSCDKDGHVIGLDLSYQFISAGLDNSSSLFKLQHLQSLNLAYNFFESRQIPSGFDRLANLTYLNLSNAGFVGQIPIQISRLTSDSTIFRTSSIAQSHGDTWRRRLVKGPITRISLPAFPQNGSLQTLVLMNTNFSGELPNSIGNLKLLSYLDLSYCGFNGSIPASMAKLDQLQYLDLSANHFTGLLPSSLSGWSKSLTELKLAHNRLTGPIPLFWNKKFVKLFKLSLRNNSLNGSISPGLFTLPSLERLDLSQNQFTGRLSEFPNETSQVDTLDLSSNKLEGPIPPSIFQLSSLIVLTLSSNKFNSTLNLDMFQRFRNLSSLDLSSNNFSIDTRVANPAMFPQLTTLNLRSCNLSVIPDFLRNQSSLSSLDLSNNQIRGKLPNWIWRTTILFKLNMSKNCLEDLEQPLLAPLFISPLIVIDLSSNMLQGMNLPMWPLYANFLDYSNNKFTNAIPHNISSLHPFYFALLSFKQ